MFSIHYRFFQFVFIILFIFFNLMESVYAWDCHFLLTYVALKNMPEVSHQPTIPAEPLNTFITKERLGLIKLLRENEVWSQKNSNVYTPLPENIAFKGDNTKPLPLQFAEAIRINPILTFPLFVQYPPDMPHRIHHHPLTRSAVMLADMAQSTWIYTPNPPLEGVSPDEKVSPLEIITSAVDEPDYGMDIHLWQNNPTWYGKIYQWGEQPFANKTLSFGSQAPFHMGFYYESSMIYRVAPFLQHCYPEYRIHLYMTLSRYAFQTGHPYWGYRFLGWALHYVQDLSQPYHATVAPNISALKLIEVNALNEIGSHVAKQSLTQLISNRHFTLENYVYYFLKKQLVNNDQSNLMIKSLTDQRIDKNYPAYSHSYPRMVVAKETHALADVIDEGIRKYFPKKYTMDPSYIFYTTETNVDLLSVVENLHQDMQLFNSQLTKILGPFGAHTRNTVRYGLSLTIS